MKSRRNKYAKKESIIPYRFIGSAFIGSALWVPMILSIIAGIIIGIVFVMMWVIDTIDRISLTLTEQTRTMSVPEVIGCVVGAYIIVVFAIAAWIAVKNTVENWCKGRKD